MRPWPLLLVVLIIPAGLASPLQGDALSATEDLIASLSGKNIHDCVATWTQDPEAMYRVMGTPQQARFREKYGDSFARLGLASAEHRFETGGPGVGAQVPTGGTNIVAVLPGRDLSTWIVVGGHYDTREATVGGGALDNASGACSVLELARATKDHVDRHGPLAHTLVFAWYDGEEWGLFGARAFADDPSVAMELLGTRTAPTVLVSQSFDMPGLNYPAKNHWLLFGNETDVDEYAVLNLRTAPTDPTVEWACWSYGCYEDLKARDDFEEVLARNRHYQAVVRAIAYDVLGLPEEHVWVYDDAYGRSDHIPLIAKGAAGMRIQGSHDEEYPHYHMPTDTLPGLYALAGGQEALIAGYETEIRVGGGVAFYMAVASEGATVDQATPAIPVFIVLAALALCLGRKS